MKLFPFENILPHHGQVTLDPEFLPQAQANQYFSDLATLVPWTQQPIKIFGKKIMQPRLTAWYGDPKKSYSYSGITLQPLPWLPVLESLRTELKNITGFAFNSALLNFYRDGSDSMGWHRDNEKELGTNPAIASINLGATRIFQLRSYHNHKEVFKIQLTHGSLLLMTQETQHYWEHAVLKTKEFAAGRINITFRVIK